MDLKPVSSPNPLSLDASLKMKTDAKREDILSTNKRDESARISETIQKDVEKLESKEITKEEVEKQIDSINNFLELNFTALKFNYHEKLDRMFVQVVNRETDEIVREIPPEEFLDMVSSMMEHVGLLIDRRI